MAKIGGFRWSERVTTFVMGSIAKRVGSHIHSFLSQFDMPKLVFYYIQKESGSTLQHPDCFAINKWVQ